MELIPGQLYRAVSADDLVEVEPPQFSGLKLLTIPENIKRLKAVQKAIEKLTGHRPDLTLVLNALLLAERDLSKRVPEDKYLQGLASLIDQIKEKENIGQQSSKKKVPGKP